MAIRKVVTNTDIGKGLEIENDKLTVAVDGDTIKLDGDILSATIPEVKNLTSAELNGTSLDLSFGDGSTISVDLDSLVPAAKADRFLSDVSYDEESNTFIFTTSEDGENDETISVPIKDIVDNFKLQVSSASDNALVLRDGKLYVAPSPTTGDTVQDLAGNNLGKLVTN